MRDLQSQLIRLGYREPTLRPHLRKILHYITSGVQKKSSTQSLLTTRRLYSELESNKSYLKEQLQQHVTGGRSVEVYSKEGSDENLTYSFVAFEDIGKPILEKEITIQSTSLNNFSITCKNVCTGAGKERIITWDDNEDVGLTSSIKELLLAT